MKIQTTFLKITTKLAALVAVFAMVGMSGAPALAQYSYDYGGGDYGYSYDYGGSDYSYDYGGSDYGYSYDYGGNDYSYDYGGGDYGYDYTYNNDYTYDYGGGDYGYEYTYNNDYTYDYGGGDYGYTYGSNDDYTYDYGGSDYGYEYTYNNDYTYDYGGGDYGYTYGSNNDYTYDYGGGDYGYDYTYNPNYTYDYGGGDTGYTYGDTHTYPYDSGYESTPYDYQPNYAYDYDYGGGNNNYDYTYGDAYDYVYDYQPGYNYDYDYTYGGGYTYNYEYNPGCTSGCIPPPRPTCTLSANPDHIDEGERTTLRWSTRYAETVSISDLGTVDRSGSRTLTPNSDRTYALVATGPGGTVFCSEQVVVEHPHPVDKDVSCDAFTVSDSRVEKGDTVTLTWRTTDADDVDIDHGVGDVAEDGSKRVKIDRDTTFTLTARNGSETDTCKVEVEIEEEEEEKDVSCDAFTVSDSRVEKGDKLTLTWRTTGADDVSINNGVGDVADDGNKKVTINRDTTFTLTARNGSETDTCKVEVEIEEEEEDDKEAPRCRLTISDTQITSGQKVTLSWDNLRTDRIVLKDSHGKELADSKKDRKIDEDKDSLVVRPTRSTEYTLTAYSGNVKRTCTVGAEVGGVTLTSVRSQDKITLSQVPYTGFEAGPVLTVVFYSALALWGAAVAYALVLKKAAITAVAGVAAGAQAPAFAAVMAPPELVAPIVTASAMATAVPANLPTTEFEELVEVTPIDEMVRALEAHAHEQYALISSDALRFIASQHDTQEAQIGTLNRVIALAKARFPKEGDWVVINKERVLSVLS